MKRLLAVAALLVAVTASPAHGGPGDPDEWFPMRLDNPRVCVVPDFPVIGSGWRLHAAVASWNEAQSSVTLAVGAGDDCSLVRVHRYDGDDTSCGFANFDDWGVIAEVGGVVRYTRADVWLNNACTTTKRLSKYVIAHEVGHALGLPHSFGSRSVMSYSCNVDRTRGNVQPVDGRALTALYAS